MHVKSSVLVLFLAASLHLIAQLAHNYSHDVAGVDLSLTQLVFVVLVVTVLPWLAIVVAWKWHLTRGVALFALSMAASFLFGYVNHFVLDGPDLHANVVMDHRSLFFHTALMLALLEFGGFVLGLSILAQGAIRSWNTKR